MPNAIVEQYGLYQVTHRDMAIHWTGLAFSRYDLTCWPKGVEGRILTEIQNCKEKGTEAGLLARWKDFQEALRYLEEFWEWWHAKTYPPRFLRQDDPCPFSEEEMAALEAEHVKRAREYIRDYSPLSVVDPDKFTDKVPEAMRFQYREAMGLIHHVIESARLVSTECKREDFQRQIKLQEAINRSGDAYVKERFKIQGLPWTK